MTANEDLLFVELALKRGLVTQEQVDEILALQKQLTGMGLSESVADLMVKKGALKAKDSEAIRVKVSPKGGRQQITGYRLIERLGRGGMGSVYKAVQLSMDRPVAIKVLKPSLANDDSRIERLRREAQLVGQLKHPNIVQGLDVGVSHGFHYFAMEYVEGKSVREIIESEGPLKEKEALRIVREVTLALDYAHREGIVHRDVKPGNILLAKDGAVKLADYGLAKGPLEDVELTHSGVTVGTPQYISPEQAQGPSDVDIRTDLYSLGATLYHMVAGRPPYQGETLAHLIQQVLYEPYAPPRSLRRDLSPDISFLIEKLMARKPRHRYQSPRELLRDLDAIEGERSIIPSGWQGDFEAYHLRRRLRRLVAACVALFLLGAGAGTVILWQMKEQAERRERIDAQTEYGRLVSNVPLAAALQVAISLLDEFIEHYDGLPEADLARELRETYRRQQQHSLDTQRGFLRAWNLTREGEYGEFAQALDLAMRSKERAEAAGEDGRYALEFATAEIGKIKTRRDDVVARKVAEEIENLVHGTTSPEAAQTQLDAEIQLIEPKAYLIEEPRTALEKAKRLERLLGRAITWTERHLRSARELLDSPNVARDYREIRKALEEGIGGFRRDGPLQAALEGLEPVWKQDLEGRFGSLDEAIVEENRVEALQTLEAALALEEGAHFEEAIRKLREVTSRSLPEVTGPLDEKLGRLEQELESRRSEVDKAWAAFLPRYLERLQKRKWDETRVLVGEIHAAMGRYLPNDYLDRLLPAGEHLLESCRMVETACVEKVTRAGHLPDGLRFASIRYRPVSDVRVEGRKITFLYNGTRQEEDLGRLSVDDLFRYPGFADDPGPMRTARGVLLLGEMKHGDPRDLLQAYPDLIGEIQLGRIDPVLAPLVDLIVEQLRFEQAKTTEAVAGTEEAARVLFEQAVRDYEDRWWQKAYDLCGKLLDEFGDTTYVQERRSQIETLRDEARKRLPVADLQEYFKARADHLAGTTVNRANYEVALFFDLEDPAELSRFRFDRERIGIVEIERILFGPAATPEEEAAATATEHLLGFHPPKGEDPADWLQRHPLRLDSPFLYSREMSVEFLVRWERPLAFLVSLSGTNLIALTDDGRPENGRGVHIWQGADLGRPDRAVPPELRNTWLAKHPEALVGEAATGRYFQFEGDRWYRVRFVKGEKVAALHVDGRLVFEREIDQYGGKGKEIVILTYAPCQLDELRFEGTVDPEWYHRVK